jgi:hypothetical protein
MYEPDDAIPGRSFAGAKAILNPKKSHECAHIQCLDPIRGPHVRAFRVGFRGPISYRFHPGCCPDSPTLENAKAVATLESLRRQKARRDALRQRLDPGPVKV